MSGDLKSRVDADLVEFLTQSADVEPIDPRQAQEEIIRRILAAESTEDILAEQSAIHARDVLDQTLKLIGFRKMESDYNESGPSFYYLLECVNADGEPFNVTCGAVNVMAQVFALAKRNALPLDVMIVESGKATKAGYKPMWLKAAPAAF